MKKRMLPIDPARLTDCLAARKLTPEQASLRLGYCKIFLRQCMTRRTVSEACIAALDAVYGIKWDEYRVLPPPEPVVEKAPEAEPQAQTVNVTVNIDYDELFKVVYLATYKAMQKALKEDGPGGDDEL